MGVTGEHEQKLTIKVDVYVPDHADRTATAIFNKTRRKLIENNPSAKCAVDNGHCDHDNPLELHHQHVEWCDSNGVDWDKIKALVPDFDWAGFDPKYPETFIDSEWNANLVLCRKHHIGVDHGIHMLPFPTWAMQRVQKADFVFSPDEES